MPTIEDGRSALEAGNLQQARLIYETILQETPRNEEAWLGLADVLTDTNDKRICYENTLKINRNNQVAREGLRNLEPEEDPFVAALKEQTASMAMEDEEPEDDEDLIDANETAISARSAGESGSETPIPVLIAVGLGLSVIVFAILAGVVFFLLTSMTGL
jgi:thioredoxin-like negative regulator of GroEL